MITAGNRRYFYFGRGGTHTYVVNFKQGGKNYGRIYKQQFGNIYTIVAKP